LYSLASVVGSALDTVVVLHRNPLIGYGTGMVTLYSKFHSSCDDFSESSYLIANSFVELWKFNECSMSIYLAWLPGVYSILFAGGTVLCWSVSGCLYSSSRLPR